MADLIDRYQEALVTITDEAESLLGPVWAAWIAGTVAEGDLRQFIEAITVRAATRASLLASHVATAAASRFTGVDHAPAATIPRIVFADPAGTIPAGVPTIRASISLSAAYPTRDGMGFVTRQIRRSVYDTASQTWTREVFPTTKEQKVTYWTRRAEAGTKCKVCTGLADGTVMRYDTEMIRHAGCRCVQQPAEYKEQA